MQGSTPVARALALVGRSSPQRFCVVVMSLGLFAFAYRALVFARSPAASRVGFEDWFFLSDPPLTLPTLAIALWMVVRRARAVRSTNTLPPSRLLLSTGVAAGFVAFVLAVRSETQCLLLVSLALHFLALGGTRWGSGGVRAFAMPAAVVLLGMQIPPSVAHEWTWNLQLWTARDAAALLTLLGQGVGQAGTLIWTDNTTFHVIEGCSGLRGIAILLLVALVVSELFARSAYRFVPILMAPLLGYGLNIVRVSLIALNQPVAAKPGAPDLHLMQGVFVLAGGAAMLYVTGWALDRADRKGAVQSQAEAARASQPPQRQAPLAGATAVSPGRTLAYAICLAIASVVIPARPTLNEPYLELSRFPHAAAGWTSAPLSPQGLDKYFYGDLPWSQIVYRRYAPAEAMGKRGFDAVDVFIVADLAYAPDTRKHFSSRLRTPGVDYRVVETKKQTIWSLGIEGESSLLERGGDATRPYVGLTWRLRDANARFESLARLVAWGPAINEPKHPAIAVRLLAPSASASELAIDQARRRLADYVEAFRNDLEAIGAPR